MTPNRWMPNALSLFRMFSAVPAAWLLWDGKVAAAMMILLAAGATDLADGFLARKFGWRTAAGSWLDPAADKTLITVLLVTLTARGFLPAWFCMMTIIRDAGLMLGIALLLSRGIAVEIRPLTTGKLAIVSQNVVLFLAITHPLWKVSEKLLPFFLGLSAFLTALSAVTYGKALAVKAGWLRPGRN